MKQKISHKSVTSSNIESFGYHPESMTLEMKFKNNPKVYSYDNVPDHVVDGFNKAPSKGSYFHKHIRNVY